MQELYSEISKVRAKDTPNNSDFLFQIWPKLENQANKGLLKAQNLKKNMQSNISKMNETNETEILRLKIINKNFVKLNFFIFSLVKIKF